MKCEFSSKGVLRLVPESEVEQFALSKWNRADVEVMEKDYFYSSIEAGKELLKLIEERRAEYEEFRQQRATQRTSGD